MLLTSAPSYLQVLHIDRNDYYGGESASLQLKQFYHKFRGDAAVPDEAKLGKQRDYCVDLIPKFIMASGKLVQVRAEFLWNTSDVRVSSRGIVSIEGSAGEPLLNADGEPTGGLACGSFGLSRDSALNPFEPQTATLNELKNRGC